MVNLGKILQLESKFHFDHLYTRAYLLIGNLLYWANRCQYSYMYEDVHLL